MPDILEKQGEVTTKATTTTEVFAGVFLILVGLLLIRIFGAFFAGAVVTLVGLFVLAF
ncbi:MAG: hypothetical protein AB1523_05590 [Bacillota bacterium]